MLPWYLEQLRSFANQPVNLGGGVSGPIQAKNRAKQAVTQYQLQNPTPNVGRRQGSRKSSSRSVAKPQQKAVSLGRPQPQGPMPYQSAFTGGPFNINTSIVPRDIYSPHMTQLAVNQSVADAHQAGDLRSILAASARPGISTRSPASLAAAMPRVASANIEAATARGAIPFSDAMANTGNRLAGEVNRENEYIALAQLASNLSNAQRSHQLNTISPMIGLLQQFA